MKIYTDNNQVSVIQLESGYYRIAHGDGHQALVFQSGNPAEFGTNGVTLESMLAVLIHHLTGLNDKVSCAENLEALEGMARAMEALNARTERVSPQNAVAADGVADVVKVKGSK